MKLAVNKSQVTLPLKAIVPNQQKNDLKTNTTSRQRSQVQSIHRDTDQSYPKSIIKQQTVSSKNIKIPSKSQENNRKVQQLFSVIETFYISLCQLPLKNLISSSEPHLWLEDQTKTMFQLIKKLDKIKKHRDYTYYCSKLESVQIILNNIKDNLSMLNRIGIMNNYHSSATDSSNYNSADSSHLGRRSRQHQESDDSKGVEIVKGRQLNIKEMLSYDQYVIKPEDISKQKSGCSASPKQIIAQTLKSQIDQSQEEQSEGDYQFYRNMAKSDILIRNELQNNNKNKSLQKVFTKRAVATKGEAKFTKSYEIKGANIQNENINRMNVQDHLNQGLNFRKKKKIENQDLKDKTLTKINNIKPSSSLQTINNLSYGRSTKFLQDQLHKYSQTQQKNDTKRTDEATIEYYQQFSVEENQKMKNQSSSSISQRRQNEFIDLIKQLRIQLMEKDKQIQQLLINQQAYEEKIQTIKHLERQKNMEILFLQEGNERQSRERQNLTIEIGKLKRYEQQLKQTIRHERERNKRESKQKQSIEVRYQGYISQNSLLKQQLQKLRQENKSAKRNQKLMKEKLEIYTKKYYQSLGEIEDNKKQKKQMMKQLDMLWKNQKKQDNKYLAIQQIVEHQKQQIMKQN